MSLSLGVITIKVDCRVKNCGIFTNKTAHGGIGTNTGFGLDFRLVLQESGEPDGIFADEDFDW